ncbi:MAG: hypothetical protein WC658_00805, partial [Candidatus Omnitrophota bacterium]
MKKRIIKVIAFILCFSLLFEQSGFAQIAGQLDLSGYFSGLRQSFTQDKFRPLHLRYLSYDNVANTFKLLLDKGDGVKGAIPLEETTKTLLKYVFIGITLPNESFWVNLRPDSPDNIIDPALAQTDIGKILLEADLQLKKDTAQATSPETPEGRKYWDKLYKKAEELFGYENVTIPTLTRPWIVPDEIIIRESKDNAYIYKATLKVMLEQDYLKDSATYNFKDPRLKALNEYSSQLMRELIIPKLTQEINTSKRYASLRQVYYSLILAQWFKARFYGKGGLYSWLINKQNLTGLTSKGPWSKTTYFNAYQQSFKDGEYNIQEPRATPFGQTVRSYFSGGMDLNVGGMPQPGGQFKSPRGGYILSIEAMARRASELIGGAKKYLAGLVARCGSRPGEVEVVSADSDFAGDDVAAAVEAEPAPEKMPAADVPQAQSEADSRAKAAGVLSNPAQRRAIAQKLLQEAEVGYRKHHLENQQGNVLSSYVAWAVYEYATEALGIRGIDYFEIEFIHSPLLGRNPKTGEELKSTAVKILGVEVGTTTMVEGSPLSPNGVAMEVVEHTEVDVDTIERILLALLEKISPQNILLAAQASASERVPSGEAARVAAPDGADKAQPSDAGAQPTVATQAVFSQRLPRLSHVITAVLGAILIAPSAWAGAEKILEHARQNPLAAALVVAAVILAPFAIKILLGAWKNWRDRQASRQRD